jgi:CheY-like chemotaxis protein
VADDDPTDRRWTQEAVQTTGLGNPLYFVEDGEELLDYLRRRGRFRDADTAPRPGVILLDLNLPRLDGREALREIKGDPDLHLIPVVVLTTSQAEEDLMRCYDLGANSFITKPDTFEALVAAIRTLGEYWFGIVRIPNGRVGA